MGTFKEEATLPGTAAMVGMSDAMEDATTGPAFESMVDVVVGLILAAVTV